VLQQYTKKFIDKMLALLSRTNMSVTAGRNTKLDSLEQKHCPKSSKYHQKFKLAFRKTKRSTFSANRHFLSEQMSAVHWRWRSLRNVVKPWNSLNITLDDWSSVTKFRTLIKNTYLSDFLHSV